MANQLARMQQTLDNMAHTQFQFAQPSAIKSKEKDKGKIKASKSKRDAAYSSEQQKVGNDLYKVLKPTFEKQTGKIVGMFLKANSCGRLREVLEAHTRGDKELMTTANEYRAELRKKK